MKKVMLLGGSSFLIPVIKEIHDLGFRAITCDYLPENIAHKYADEYHNVSILEKEKVLDLARELKIDGIMSFACDPGVATAAYVAEKMNLPYAGSYEAVSILQNKGLFRKFLADNGFNVPVAKSYKKVSDALADTESLNWPVVVKPTDSAGSKGVTRVDKPEDLEAGIQFAMEFSHCNEFIVEDYLEQKGYASDTDSFSIDGQLKFISFNCQYFSKDAENPYTPSAFSWPSSMSQEHQDELAGEMQRLVNLLGLKTSLYNVETRECVNGKAYIMEFSPRAGGNRLSEMLHRATGVNLIRAAVKAAVGIPVDDEVSQRPYNGWWAELVLHGEKTGLFKSVYIAEELKPYVEEEDIWVEPGDLVNAFSGANMAVGYLVFKFPNNELLQQMMGKIDDLVKIEVISE